MQPDRKLYAWPEVDNVPSATGIYAWYYRHLLTDFDIFQLKSELKALLIRSQFEEAASMVRRFLQEHIFVPLAEEPYEASLTGPLRPRYEGKLHYQATISQSLVERIVAEPDRLVTLKKLLAEAIPEFASPIYIGMSVDLRARIRRHKRLIETYKTMEVTRPSDWDSTVSEEERADHSFARDVVRRGLSVNRLEVSIRQINAPESVHVDAENILNRINHPLCGRN